MKKLLLLIAFSVLLLVPVGAQNALALSVFINEIHYDNSGTDTGEFVEIAGPAGTDLTGFSLVLYNGATGAPYNTISLSGVLDDEGKCFGALDFQFPTNGIQNGAPDGLALVDGASSVLQFLSYEGTFNAVGGPANGMMSIDIGVAESSGTAAGESLQLKGTGSVFADFTFNAPSTDSPGDINAGQNFISASCGMAVGGEMIPLDTASLLLAGTSSVAAWMIPALISAVGIGIVLARKF